MSRPIALLTDFGLKDHYVGSLKSVILGINPRTVIFDITHDIRPQNIREGALVLHSVYSVLPKGTIVVAVVDPGVGSMRQALCVKTARGFLIAPDNGILSLVLRDEDKFEARKITNGRYFRKPVSLTFHGRDIFAPAAAWLSKKNVFHSFGPRIYKLHHLRIPHATKARDSMKGEIIYVDHFGNAITNISRIDFESVIGSGEIHIVVKKEKQVPLKPFFSAGTRGKLIAVWNSSDLLELAVRDNSAAERYHLRIGDPVMVRLAETRTS